jgi:deazaflavin-dependent oxidoreductase (nitroreductase family)
MTQGMPDTETLKAFNKTVSDEFRANDGKVGGQFEGANLLLLTTTGAKSGQPRVSPLAYFRVDDKLLILGSFAGADVNPAWVHNLRANPSAHIEIGNESSDVTARELPLAERDDLFPQITAVAPGFAEYQTKTTRIIPVFELQPLV